MFSFPEKYRYTSRTARGESGPFVVPHYRIIGYEFFIIASDGEGWEHVSITIRRKGEKASRCPTWEEMCFIKGLFWTDDDVVVQFHPKKEDYVSQHNFCLHLWRKRNSNFETPPSVLVGLKN